MTPQKREQILNLIQSAKITGDLSWYKRNYVQKIVANRLRYEQAEEMAQVPAVFLACVHALEDSSDLGKFASYIGNGQPLNRKTTIVPKGRGPFLSWEAGVKDAMGLKYSTPQLDWDLVRFIFECERYNGFGYSTRGINTPYVWSMTNHYTRGLFVRDGVFSETAVSKNIGTFALYQMLVEAIPSWKLGAKDTVVELPDVETPAWFEPFKVLIQKLIDLILGKNPAPPKTEAPESMAQKLYAIAEKEIGVKEIAGANQHNPRILEYHATTGRFSSDEVPWCASFANWVCRQAGAPETRSAMARSFLQWGNKTKKPKRGDIVVFWRNSPTATTGHVGFYHSEDATHISVLGGNQSDRVNIQRYPKKEFLDFRTVD